MEFKWSSNCLQNGSWNMRLPRIARNFLYCTREKSGAEGRNRTADTTIFSRMLYRLSYLGTEAKCILRGLSGPVKGRESEQRVVGSGQQGGLPFAVCRLPPAPLHCSLLIAARMMASVRDE